MGAGSHSKLDPSAGPIARAVARAHELLPDQGPIGVFVHHNTLHAFQKLPFPQAVAEGAAVYRARPYPSLDEFREHHRRGRIEDADLDAELRAELGARGEQPLPLGLTRFRLWRAMMTEEVDVLDGHGLAFARLHQGSTNDDLAHRWSACADRVRRGPRRAPEAAPVPARPRDALVALGAPDPDEVVHRELIHLSAAFLDQGQAQVSLQGREAGFLAVVVELYRSGASVPHLCRPAHRDLIEALDAGLSSEEIVRRSLSALGIPEAQHFEVLLSTALALPGWSGMFARLERHPEEAPGIRVRLEEFLAVRCTLERRAIEHTARDAELPSSWIDLCARSAASRPRDERVEANVLFELSRAGQAGPEAVRELTDEELSVLWTEIDDIPVLERRRIWHEAFERRYRRQILDGLAAVRARRETSPKPVRPKGQFIFCIDEREESIRRALEEQGPELETFGAAGFFGVAIDYQGLYDRRPAPHAPVVVTPGHEVHEAPIFPEREWHAQRSRMRGAWHWLERSAATRSRGLVGGAGLSLLLGPGAGVLATTRVLAPRLSLALRDRAEGWLAPVPTTRLVSLRPEGASPPTERGKPLGFSIEEAADRVTSLLQNIGMTESFAPIVVVLGHGSTSLNNPHESAHDCGACGGRRGGANARLFAELANRPDIREAVKRRGLQIPADTWFVGALHDTADDSVRYFDLEALPTHLAEAFAKVREALEAARRESALERCRRFDDAPLGYTPEEALAHVESRASHLAQPRPEYGHCTNAVCIVGRRSLSRGLFLDRRAFLVSYDPSIDPSLAIVERILAAVGPVGAGISLEYYFSSVDNEIYGSGTKLPHNVTGLLGVMNGHEGDLRTGLPWQMVEIHEPMRLLLIVEATPEALLQVAGRQPEVSELVVNRWVQLVSVHPQTGDMRFFERATAERPAGFVPYEPDTSPLPVVPRSRDWYGKSREHLPPALVTSAEPSRGAT